MVLGEGIGGAAVALLLASSGLPTTLLGSAAREAPAPPAEPSASGALGGDRGAPAPDRAPVVCLGPRGALSRLLRRAGAEGAIAFRRAPLTLWLPRPSPSGAPDTPSPKAPPRRVPLTPTQPGLLWSLRALVRGFGQEPRAALGIARLVVMALAATEAELVAWRGRPLSSLLDTARLQGQARALVRALTGLVFAPPLDGVDAAEALRALRACVEAGGIARTSADAATLAQTLRTLSEARGAQLRDDVRPQRILVKDGQVRGVVLEGGALLPAAVVVSALDPAQTAALLDEEDVANEEDVAGALAARLRAMGGARAALVLQLRVRGRVLGDEAILCALEEQGRLVGAVFCTPSPAPPLTPGADSPPTPPTPPARASSGMTDDADLLHAHVFLDGDDVPERSSEALQATVVEALTRVIPTLAAQTCAIDAVITLPLAGAAPTGWQGEGARPPVFTAVRGLYLAGSTAGGRGAGVDLAASSAMECADRILVDLGRDPGCPPPLRPREVVRALSRRGLRALAAWLGPAPDAAPAWSCVS
ncbi:Carotenoid cis-trans isomerase [Chondromyces apiculatus DSM 436]|uniref:Carotenoid cis-trans isomerase n=1 Tax=Chondromyces apiculatus DSM 436 TaxID=1192034 RepID=A0A017TDC6_9BACT|nr:Carotenoid cis-trans isomerase [Chondromyces apiculatus DSM 436]